MKTFSLPQALGSIAVALATFSSAKAEYIGYENPLATLDQRSLDALAIEIYQNNSFIVLKAEANVAYQTAHGLPISDEASSTLDAAIEELVFSATQNAVNNDPYYLKVYWVDVPGGKYFYDNPDCIYRIIPISSDVDYMVTGYRHKPGPTDVSFSLISDPNSQNFVAYLAGSNLAVIGDGSYTITNNSSPADGQTNQIQFTTPAKHDITGHSAISTAGIIADAKWNLQEAIVDYGVGTLGLKTTVSAVNTLSTPSQSSTLGTPASQDSSFGHFNLTDDEALVVTLTPGAADYFVFPGTNPWMVTVDPGSSQISLNNKQSVANEIEDYTFVVSVTDPGVYNEVKTTGLREGTIMVRWQGLNPSSSSTESVALEVQKVELSDLASVIPSKTRYVTTQERALQLADCVAGYSQD
ncbi:uncharacterized protein BO97DRAFT_473160 [Aspergillus homomorphus CBS 101889]|uniref:Uncharacterized protein n=1 Tax=Aspergillus homomorphus (strain CBS 101889) TaxID=1450537 RepID=A0A395HLZ2_ASPHC|nr:hypothetical protein BO97DRAFT_473160 [Aspergillus homomorphus CBS 101889]RAL08245.1 hypothetical protein BO97DRAFT_473160 [Aspergillus homomorphus CBS 101889]